MRSWSGSWNGEGVSGIGGVRSPGETTRAIPRSPWDLDRSGSWKCRDGPDKGGEGSFPGKKGAGIRTAKGRWPAMRRTRNGLGAMTKSCETRSGMRPGAEVRPPLGRRDRLPGPLETGMNQISSVEMPRNVSDSKRLARHAGLANPTRSPAQTAHPADSASACSSTVRVADFCLRACAVENIAATQHACTLPETRFSAYSGGSACGVWPRRGGNGTWCVWH